MPSKGNFKPSHDNASRHYQYRPNEPRSNGNRRDDVSPRMNGFSGFDQGRYMNNQSSAPIGKTNAYLQPKSMEPQQQQAFSVVQNSKNRTRLVLLILLAIFLTAAFVLGAIATSLTPWWKYADEGKKQV